MSLILASLLAAPQTLPFIDRSALRSLAVAEAQVRRTSEHASALSPRKTKMSATLCAVAGQTTNANSSMVGAGDSHLVSSRVMAMVRSACSEPIAKPMQEPAAVLASR